MAKAKKAAASDNPNQLYELLRVERTATDKEIRKAYLVLSRAVHPDRNPSPHAQQDFIALKKAYDILSDATKRERYDRTGQVDDESQSFADAYERYRGVPVSEEDIVSYMEGYRNSEAEQQDLLEYFEAHRGDVSRILGSIVGSTDKDIPRFVKFLKEAIRSGKVSAAYKRAFVPSSVMKEAELEAECEELGEDLGEEEDDEEDGEDEEDEDEDEDEDEEDDEDQEEEEEEEVGVAAMEVEAGSAPGDAGPPPGVPAALWEQIRGKQAARRDDFQGLFARAEAAGKAEAAAAKRKQAAKKAAARGAEPLAAAGSKGKLKGKGPKANPIGKKASPKGGRRQR